MKLKNLLFATMVACAFTACSNEDDPIVGPVTPEGEAAEASIAFSTSIDGVRTKAATTKDAAADLLAAESKVNTLTVIAFNGDGVFLGSKTATFEETPISGEYDVPAFKVKLATGATEMGVKVLAIANMDAKEFTNKSLEQVCAIKSTLANAASITESGAGAGFIMSSDVISGDVEAGKVAVFGRTAAENEVAANAAPIYLYRLAARVDMGTISVNFDQTTNLRDATVRIDNVFMLNVRESSLLANSTDTKGGAVANTTANWLAGLDVADAWKKGFLADGTHEVNAYLNQAVSSEGDIKKIIASSDNLSLDINKSFYVLETGDAKDLTDLTASTILVIQTTLFANGDDTKGKTKYYSIKVNKDGFAEGTTGDGKVHRNTIYKIATATLTGEGSSTPTTVDASYQITAQVVVKDWTVVEQTPDIE